MIRFYSAAKQWRCHPTDFTVTAPPRLTRASPDGCRHRCSASEMPPAKPAADYGHRAERDGGASQAASPVKADADPHSAAATLPSQPLKRSQTHVMGGPQARTNPSKGYLSSRIWPPSPESSCCPSRPMPRATHTCSTSTELKWSRFPPAAASRPRCGRRHSPSRLRRARSLRTHSCSHTRRPVEARSDRGWHDGPPSERLSKTYRHQA